MGSNSKEYAKKYNEKKRRDRIAKLGDKCFMCSVQKNLIVHRIYTSYNTTSINDRLQLRFKDNIGSGESLEYMSEDERKKLDKNLLTNYDNMVLLCRKCYAKLRHYYGRKRKIGRKEIYAFAERD